MAGQFCVQCGDALTETYLFCPQCGAKVAAAAPPSAAQSSPEAGPAPATAAGTDPAAAAESTSTLANFARIAKTIALLTFLLPWVTISCAGQPLVTINGLSLISGRVTVRDPMSGIPRTQSGSPEILVILALLAIAIGLFVSFALPRRRAALAAIWSCGAGLLLIFSEIFIRLPAAIRQSAMRGSRSNRFDPSFDAMISVQGAIGFWLCVIALIAAIALHWQIRSRAPPDP